MSSRILIVEDEALIAADLEERLSSLGYVIVGIVDTGEDAVRQATALHPDLILMDIRLRGQMDGIQAAEAIRHDGQIPVVFLTAHADRQTLLRAGLTEPFGYLVKPFDERDLLATIEMAFYRHQAELRLRSMERWLATTLQSIAEGVLATDLQGRITFINRVAEQLIGMTRREVLGRTFHEVLPLVYAGTQERVPDPVTQALTHGVVINLDDTYLLPQHGDAISIDNSAAPIRDDENGIIGAVVILRDRSERKRLEAERHRIEEALRDAQKLESLGILAGGIAHDFNNLLTGVLANADLCQQHLPPDVPIQKYLHRIAASSQRAADLCRQLLAYAGKGQFTQQPVDLSALVADTVNLMRLAVSKQTDMQLHLAPHLPEVVGDASQLQQIVMNLVMNAAEALGDAPGEIQLVTGTMHASREYLVSAVTAPQNLAEDEYVFLEVTDTGCGIARDVLAKIFDPFFTTKFTGRGLGLAAVLGIVRRHNGALTVDSEPGKGTTFRLLLPKAVTLLSSPETPNTMSADWHCTGLILIVDDEMLVREVLREIVEAIGFEVIEATNGREALALCQTHGARLTAILLDLTMPEMDGAHTLRELRQQYPALPVFLMSGYAEQEASSELAANSATFFVQKPFSAVSLRDKLRAVLGV